MASRLLRHKGWRFYGPDGKDKDSFGADVISAGTSYTDTQAKDAVGGILTDTTEVDFTYVSASSITAQLKTGSIVNSKLADAAAWSYKVRNAGTSGAPSDAALADFTASGAVGADYIVGFKSTGEIRKFAASDFGVTGAPTAAEWHPFLY